MRERVTNTVSKIGCVEHVGKCDCCDDSPKRGMC